MAESQYRLQTEEGLSKQYSLARLIEKHSAGVVSGSVRCTPDDGSTWTSLNDLIQQQPAPQKNSASKAGPDSESASITQSETAVNRSTDPEPLTLKSSGRRLKRLQAGGVQSSAGNSRKRKRLTTALSEGPAAEVTQSDESDSEPESPFDSEIKSPEDLIGVQLANERYTITGKLGKGSMAYVLRASDSRLLTDVVVKVPKPEKMTDADIRDRFRRESQLLVQLTHPHVVKVLDVGEYSDLPYVVMQLLSGGTLTDRINDPANNGKGMPPDSLKTWLREVARALDFCYRKGMVHRDVKPANILFDEDENAYVSDFGLTKIMYGDYDNIDPSDTASGVVLGTPNYISPEVVLGKGYDGRADQYSLGITVYHTLFGKAPMQGDNATATMINQTQKRLQLLSDIRSDVPRELALAVRKSIEKKPEARFDTCEEFAEAVIEGLRVPPGTQSIPTAATDWGDGDAATASSSSSSAQRRRSSNSSRSARSGQASRQSAVIAEVPVADEALDWLEPASTSSASLPPRRGKATSGKSSRKKSAARQNSTVIFGQEVHPGLVIGFAVGVAALVISIIVRYATAPDLNDGPPIQDFSGTTFEASQEELAEGYSEQHAAESSANAADAAAAGRDKQPAGNPSSHSQKSTTVAAKPVNSTAASASNNSSASKPSLSETSNGSVVATSDPSDSGSNHSPPSAATTDSVDAAKQNLIPYTAADPLTVPAVDTPVLVVGNRVWEKASAEFSTKLQGQYAADALTSLSPDGRLFAAAGKSLNQTDSDVHVWDTTSGKKLFTAKGQPDRYVDCILLSANRLLLGSRWKDTLQVWNTEDGSQQKDVKLSGVTIHNNNATISPDGEFVAVVSNHHLGIIRAANGRIVGAMRSPRQRPGNPKAANSGQDQGNQEVYESLAALKFSPGGRFLAAVATEPTTRILCWNSSGELEVDHALPELNGTEPTLQWLNDSSGWRIGNQIVDRESTRVTAVAPHARDVRFYLYDDAHIVAQLPTETNGLQLRDLPALDIAASLKSIHSTDAFLSLTHGASVQVLLPEKVSAIDAVERALQRALSRNDVRIEDEQQETQFTLQRPAADDELTLQLVADGQTRWSAAFTIKRELDDDEFVRQLSAALEDTVIPYFIPRDPAGLSLPYVIE
ncbi:MAG: hypothetical protein Fues2KO_13340 [Fuerstiella sp.]